MTLSQLVLQAQMLLAQVAEQDLDPEVIVLTKREAERVNEIGLGKQRLQIMGPNEWVVFLCGERVTL